MLGTNRLHLTATASSQRGKMSRVFLTNGYKQRCLCDVSIVHTSGDTGIYELQLTTTQLLTLLYTILSSDWSYDRIFN